jgi:hypothetical protein
MRPVRSRWCFRASQGGSIRPSRWRAAAVVDLGAVRHFESAAVLVDALETAFGRFVGPPD